jgi:CBS domain containing-hemolysin-like protein
MIEIFNIFIVVLLVLANGFFVASEFALVGVRRSRIAMLAKDGDRRAARLLSLLENLNGYISATQLGITLASLALGWLGEPAIAHLLEVPLKGRVSDTVLHAISFTIAFTIITFLHIVLGELAPKTLALERAEKTALAVALPMEIFYKVFSYPIRLLDWAGTRTVRFFGLHPTAEHGEIYTAEELRLLIDKSHKSGHVAEVEKRLINRVFDFSDAEVREAMVPRIIVEALPITATLEQVKQSFRALGYSRLPVYREHLDNIAGVIFRRDLEPFLENPHDQEFKLEDLLHAPLFVAERAPLGEALKQMQSSRTHLAFVMDEYGGMEGIVTLEDLLEEIVGEINDEYDEEVRSQIVEDKGTYLLDGMLAVRDANRHLRLALPEDGNYTTIAGFMLAQAGRLLKKGEAIEFEGGHFTVERLDRLRIHRVRYTPVTKTTQHLAPVLFPLVWQSLYEAMHLAPVLL